MASKRKIFVDSSDSFSSFSSGEEEDGSSSEENQAQTPKSPPSKKPRSSTKTPSQPKSSSGEGSDSIIEPVILSQKRSVAAKPSPDSPPPPKSTKRARKSTDEGAKSSERAKVAHGSSKKPKDASRGPFEPAPEPVSQESSVAAKPSPAAPIERLWSEADEKALLNGMILFEKERGMKVSKDVHGFFEFIEGSLQCKVKLSQLKFKMAKLKKKFRNNMSKSGGELKFASSHNQDCFDLSMRLWGSAGGLGESTRVSGVKSGAAKKSMVKGNVEKAAVQADFLLSHFLRSGVGAANMEEMLKSGLEMFQGQKKTELEEKFMKFHVEQLELYLKKFDLQKELALLILEELKSNL